MSHEFAQVQNLLSQLSNSEKSQLAAIIASDSGAPPPGIDSHPDVCGGEPRIVRTRIPVWLLEQARRLGKTDSELLAAYPSLQLQDLANTWAYVRSHAEEIERQIHENEAA